MFDISLGELLVVGAVALVVLGPERLPKVARTVGALVGRAQRFVASVKADLDREMQQTELARIEAELHAEGEELRNTIHLHVVAPMQALQGGPVDPPLATEAEIPMSVPMTEVFGPAVAYDAGTVGAAQRPMSEPAVVDERQLDLFALPSMTGYPGNDRR